MKSKSSCSQLIKLSKRLQNIVNLVDENVSDVVDIGCDHGKVIANLLYNKICKFGYATDISKPSLNKCEDLLKSLNLSNYKCVFCDGMQGLQDVKKFNTVIIAGMGGKEIIKILTENSVPIKNLILSPQKDVVEVRKFLNGFGFKIVYDIVIKEDNKFYTIIKAVKGKQKHTINQLYFGKIMLKQPNCEYKQLVNLELLKLEKIKQVHKLNSNQEHYHKFLKNQVKKFKI